MELLIRVKDRAGDGRIDDSLAGSVVAAFPDGWKWSAIELSNAHWVIVRVPILQVEADALVAAGANALARRHRIDFAKLLISEQRQQPIIDVGLVEFRASIVTV